VGQRLVLADNILFGLMDPHIPYVDKRQCQVNQDTRGELINSEKERKKQKQEPEMSVEVGFAEINYRANKIM